ncbi:hypothetical protein LCGC14_2970490 [marine sediment metagenome]|uniref:Uncharacterized protein n=1 Tax=marine sediment metagenome TaxID=412755 RepID=A0A0F8XX09_9ZZZZ
MSEPPDCPEHKIPMKLIEEGKIIKSYFCKEEGCKKTVDIITITMKGDKIYREAQEKSEAEIKKRTILSQFTEKW